MGSIDLKNLKNEARAGIKKFLVSIGRDEMSNVRYWGLNEFCALVYILRDSKDTPEFFPEGKWQTLHKMEQLLDGFLRTYAKGGGYSMDRIEYAKALERVEQLMCAGTPAPNSSDAVELAGLTHAIQKYEMEYVEKLRRLAVNDYHARKAEGTSKDPVTR